MKNRDKVIRFNKTNESIKNTICLILHKLGVDTGTLSTVGSWGDTLPDYLVDIYIKECFDAIP